MIGILIAGIVILIVLIAKSLSGKQMTNTQGGDAGAVWMAPDSASIPVTAEGQLISYGRQLIMHTSEYLGPKGKVGALSNGMGK